MSSTTYLDTLILDKVLAGQNFELNSNFFLALYVQDPTKSGEQGFEVVAPEYARQPISFSPSRLNTAVIQFPKSTSTWGTISHAGICTTLTGQYLILYGTVGPVLVVANQIVRFPVGNVSVQMP